MAQYKFRAGDVVSHDDGSVYVVRKRVGDNYHCVTILECNDDFREEGSPYEPLLEHADEYLTKIGHIDPKTLEG